MVAHGFRALARTTIREKLKYDSEIIEKQLAHKTKNPLGEAYDSFPKHSAKEFYAHRIAGDHQPR